MCHASLRTDQLTLRLVLPTMLLLRFGTMSHMAFNVMYGLLGASCMSCAVSNLLSAARAWTNSSRRYRLEYMIVSPNDIPLCQKTRSLYACKNVPKEQQQINQQKFSRNTVQIHHKCLRKVFPLPLSYLLLNSPKTMTSPFYFLLLIIKIRISRQISYRNVQVQVSRITLE